MKRNEKLRAVVLVIMLKNCYFPFLNIQLMKNFYLLSFLSCTSAAILRNSCKQNASNRNALLKNSQGLTVDLSRWTPHC